MGAIETPGDLLDVTAPAAGPDSTSTDARTLPEPGSTIDSTPVDIDSDVILIDPFVDIDSEMLLSLADAGADLSQSRRIAHFLYLPDREAAAEAAAELARAQFIPTVWAPTRTETEWTVVAELRDVVVTAESIAEHDTLFETLSVEFGGRYDGWEATV